MTNAREFMKFPPKVRDQHLENKIHLLQITPFVKMFEGKLKFEAR